MKINRVILASNDNQDYLDFWPLVSESWKRLNISPTLIFTGKKKRNLEGDVIHFYIEELDPIFVAQNIRILAPALFMNENIITSDIDDLPLSRKYFLDNVTEIPNHMFTVYRAGVIDKKMIPISWNLANSKTWQEIFKIHSENEIVNRLIKWYPIEYRRGYPGWYTDQIKLKQYVNKFSKKNKQRVVYLTDKSMHFNRISRDATDGVIQNLKNTNVEYSDYHMPIPFIKHKKAIFQIYKRSIENGYI